MMSPGRITGRATPKGVAFLVTLIFVALFTCVALALVTMADTNMAIGRDRLHINQSSTLAETGLLLTQQELGGLVVSGETAASVHDEIADHFRAAWVDSTMVDTVAITANAAGVVLPPIWLTRADGRSGTIELVIMADGGAHETPSVVIQSTGRFAGAVRTAYYDLGIQTGLAVFRDYGILSKSRILITNNAKIQGANNDAEGSILSMSNHPTAIDMRNNTRVSGDAGVTDENSSISLLNNARIGGEQITDADEPEWPEIDASGLEQYVEEIVTGDVTGSHMLHNIRIPAGTNPTFDGNINLCGVIYIESPNKVTFKGNTNICGVIVTEEPPVENLSANQIHFLGNTTVSSVANLPDESRYDGLHDQTGTFMLAPGFQAKFTGNFSTIHGVMAAGQLVFDGDARGTVYGGILNLSSAPLTLTGNTDLTIDKENADLTPTGLSGCYSLVCVRGSYRE